MDEKKPTDAEAKRTGREAPDPANLPGEFLDEMRTNRFTPPPDPPRDDESGHESPSAHGTPP